MASRTAVTLNTNIKGAQDVTGDTGDIAGIVARIDIIKKYALAMR
jgi:hypothetical protein